MAQIIYKVVLQDPATDDVVELSPLSYSFEEKLNLEVTGSFKLSFEQLERIAVIYGTTTLDLLTTRLMDIYIYRNATKIMGAVPSEMSISPGENGAKNIDLKVVGYLGMFAKRIAGVPSRVFTAVDSALIGKTLVEESQASDSTYSDWNITYAALPTTVNRDRTYRFDNVKDALIRMSNNNLANGYDLQITPAKVLTFYYPTRGTNKFNVVFDERTLLGYSWKKPLLLKMNNKIYVTGQGFNDDVLYRTRTAGTGYRSPFGTLESVLNERDVKETDTLDQKGDLQLTLTQEPVTEFTAEHFDNDSLIPYTAYEVGDNIKVNRPDLGLLNQTMRVMSRSFSVDENAVGKIKLTLQ